MDEVETKLQEIAARLTKAETQPALVQEWVANVCRIELNNIRTSCENAPLWPLWETLKADTERLLGEE
jgi:hypothetical protein